MGASPKCTVATSSIHKTQCGLHYTKTSKKQIQLASKKKVLRALWKDYTSVMDSMPCGIEFQRNGILIKKEYRYALIRPVV